MNIIFGIQSTTLSEGECALFSKAKPRGIILFQRNCVSSGQIKALVAQIHNICGKDTPILIDQEGGRVSRLKSPAFKEFPAPKTFQTPKAAYDNAVLMAEQLLELGITVNCTPLADLCFPITHAVIGDRSFGQDPKYVGEMAKAVIQGHLDTGITPIIKHLPGHGRALCDSHESLPIVKTPQDELKQTDFKAFSIALDGLDHTKIWGMTAHIVYEDIDPTQCATQSNRVIEQCIRQDIGFKGLLISDCVTMKALTGTYADRIQKSLKAGCDFALHCSGNLDEMTEIFSAL
ncbi:MAG: Beta-hexosaminidase [Holosporales bacterium]